MQIESTARPYTVHLGLGFEARSHERQTNVACDKNRRMAQVKESRLKAGCSQDWLPHKAERFGQPASPQALLEWVTRVRFLRLSKDRRYMPTNTKTKLDSDMLAAAIEGLQAHKKRIDERITEVRQLMTGGSAKSAATPEPRRKRRKVSAAGR